MNPQQLPQPHLQPGQSQAMHSGQPQYAAQPGYPAGPQPGYPHGIPQQQGHPGQQPVFQAKFRKHTGLIVIAQWRDSYATGSYEQIRMAYKAAQTHNLLAGWWGLISALLYNWIAIIGNISEMNRIKRQAQAAGLEV